MTSIYPVYKHTRLLLFTLLTSCLLFSCGPTSGDAAEYNDVIITEQNKVANKGEAFYAAMDVSPEAMQKAFAEFSAQIDTSIVVTSQLGPIKEKTDFLDAAMESLRLYRSLCDNEYKEIIEILSKPDEEISTEETDRYHALVSEVQDKLDPVRRELDAAQLKFAQDWNFMIDVTKTFE